MEYKLREEGEELMEGERKRGSGDHDGDRDGDGGGGGAHRLRSAL